MLKNLPNKWLVVLIIILVVCILALTSFLIFFPRLKTSKLFLKTTPELSTTGRLFVGEDKLLPLGIDQKIGEYVNESDGLKRVWVSAIVASEPYEKGNLFYLPISFSETNFNLQNKLILGKKDGLFGFQLIPSGQKNLGGQIDTKEIKEVISYLKPGTQVRFEIVIMMEADQYQKVLTDIRCNKQCEENLLLTREYLTETQSLIDTLKNLDKGIPENKVFGPVLTLIVGQ